MSVFYTHTHTSTVTELNEYKKETHRKEDAEQEYKHPQQNPLRIALSMVLTGTDRAEATRRQHV